MELNLKLFRYCCLFAINCSALAKKLAVGLQESQIFLARRAGLRQVEMVTGEVHKHEGRTMKPVSGNQADSGKKPRTGEQAQVRSVILALVSFLLGVATTAFWFHFTSPRTTVNANSQTSEATAAEQPAAPAVNANRPARPFVPSHPPVEATAMAEVKLAIPNFASVSLADGEQILREAALKKFATAAKDMDIQIKQAQAQLVQAENGQSAAAQQAAREHLQQIQAEETEKLQEIAAHLQAQIAALQQLKGTTP
jgi:hypothetical protein